MAMIAYRGKGVRRNMNALISGVNLSRLHEMSYLILQGHKESSEVLPLYSYGNYLNMVELNARTVTNEVAYAMSGIT
ncbi:hypothetical protein Tco_0791684 [Tanacetum coccineum]